MRSVVSVLVMVAISCLAGCDGGPGVVSDAGTDGDADADVDVDADGDVDEDGDVDADGDADADGDVAGDSDGDSDGDGGYPVFPGTARRFMPGLVYHQLVGSATELEREAARLAPYQDGWLNPEENTGLFISAQIRWPEFYADHGHRPESPTDPSDPAYDWSRLDAMLESEPIASGAIDGVWLRIYVRDGARDLYPQWTIDEGTAWICPADDKEYGKWWVDDFRLLEDLQDFLSAFAARYRDDERLAGVQFPENIWSTECTDLGGFVLAGREEAVARRAIFLAEQMPNTSIITGGNFPGMEPWDLEGHEVGYFMPDVRMFASSCGQGGVWPEVTCETWNYLTMQESYGLVPMGTATEPNGWHINRSATPFSEPNPFGFVAGDRPSLDGVQGAEIFTWYVSGFPRGPVTDSGLDDVDRDDPPGVLVSNLVFFADMTWPEDFDLPQVADWDVAFRTFCWGEGEGTNACPTIPEGFRLERR